MTAHAPEFSDSATGEPPSDDDAPVAVGSSRGLVRTLLSVIVVAVVAAALSVGYVWGNDSKHTAYVPAANSVDAGFASDMSMHHQQAITMASYVRDNSTNPSVKLIAYDIETSQSGQQGEMLGWLDTWGLVRNSNTTMAWMAGHAHVSATGLMPGMATPTQLNRLLASHGAAMDLLFLQLMIHHHQGGVVMAQYAATHAKLGYVRTTAQAMYLEQSSEIVQMEQLLRQLGGTPLPPPAD
jgi:uncharacterized protein (DUF305 family)